MHGTVDHFCKVHTQERKVRIWDRINQRLYEATFICSQFVVFTPEWDDFCARIRTGKPRYAVAVETSATYKKPGLVFARCSFNQMCPAAVRDLPDFASELGFTPLFLEQFEEFLRHLAIIRDASRGHTNSGQTTDMRFDFLYLQSRKFPDRQTVLSAPLKKAFQSW